MGMGEQEQARTGRGGSPRVYRRGFRRKAADPETEGATQDEGAGADQSLTMAHWNSKNPDANAGGPPKLEFDLGLVERSAHIGCTNEEIIALLGCGRMTFYRHLKDDPALQEVIERGRDRGRAALRRMQWHGAESGNATMQIWLGKQLLDQKDKLENSGTIDNRLKVIVEFVGDAAPAIEHDKPLEKQRFTPRLVEGVEFKG